MARIAIGGLHHETNTFAPTRAGLSLFEQADGWPPLCRGTALIPTTAGVNLPINGFVEGAASHELVPLVWANAGPSGPVTRHAYETLAAMLLEDLEAALPVDAVFLDLHGAMVAEHLDDGEGELLGRVRARIGDIPLVAALDLHANVTRAMVRAADLLVAYRTYPHVDLAPTGARALRLLERRLAAGAKPAAAFRQIPYLLPLPWQCTTSEPARGLYALLEALEEAHGVDLSFCMGFPAADFPDCGASVLAYAPEPGTAERAAEALARAVIAAEGAFAGRLWSPEAAVRHAMAAAPGRPVVLADVQDNPGGGGTGDTTGLLRALVELGAPGAVAALLFDPEAAARAW
jgi:microcystin degradation protein MlrC